jgi:hypothetical protein
MIGSMCVLCLWLFTVSNTRQSYSRVEGGMGIPANPLWCVIGHHHACRVDERTLTRMIRTSQLRGRPFIYGMVCTYLSEFPWRPARPPTCGARRRGGSRVSLPCGFVRRFDRRDAPRHCSSYCDPKGRPGSSLSSHSCGHHCSSLPARQRRRRRRRGC